MWIWDKTKFLRNEFKKLSLADFQNLLTEEQKSALKVALEEIIKVAVRAAVASAIEELKNKK
jgi:hypothetical protein